MIKRISVLSAFLLFVGAALAPVRAGGKTTLFGHRPYDEAPAADLMDVGAYRQTGRVVQLRRAAGEAFLKMEAAAEADGVKLIPISGFRTIQYQKNLFDKGVRRRGSARAAAKWVAPPGHSEHHTGWTLDLGDESAEQTDVEQSFEGTKAYQWLLRRAADFDFEISFPKGNRQGISYEPWHWRFVGNDEARELFHPSKK